LKALEKEIKRDHAIALHAIYTERVTRLSVGLAKTAQKLEQEEEQLDNIEAAIRNEAKGGSFSPFTKGGDSTYQDLKA